MPQKRGAKKQSANKRRGAQDAGREGAPRSTPDMEPTTPRPGTETETEAETEVATADGEVRAGAMVKLCGLVKRSDLNGRLGFVKGASTLSQDGRWAVRLGAEDSFAEEGAGETPPNAPFATLAVVCVRPANLCILDQILAHDDQGEPMALQIRAGWNDPEDWNNSAAAVFYQLVRGLRLDGHFVNFQGTVSARCDGVWHRFRPPPVVAARLPPDQETFWDGPKLMAAIQARLASL